MCKVANMPFQTLNTSIFILRTGFVCFASKLQYRVSGSEKNCSGVFLNLSYTVVFKYTYFPLFEIFISRYNKRYTHDLISEDRC